MGDDHRQMYDSQKRNGAHTDEWWEKTSDFIERVEKRKSGELTETHTFGANGYVHMGQQVVNPRI
jgi:hypothetical protein